MARMDLSSSYEWYVKYIQIFCLIKVTRLSTKITNPENINKDHVRFVLAIYH